MKVHVPTGWLSTADVAELVGIPVWKVYRAGTDPQGLTLGAVVIRPLRAGRTVLWPEAAVTAGLASMVAVTTAPTSAESADSPSRPDLRIV